MVDALRKLYDEFLAAEGRKVEPLIDAIVASVFKKSFGGRGTPYRCLLKGEESAFGPVDLDAFEGYEGVRARVDRNAKRIEVVSLLQQVYPVTIAAQAIVADTKAREFGYQVAIHSLILPRRRRGQILLEGGAFNILQALFLTPPDALLVVDQDPERQGRANQYLRGPESLKAAIVSNMRSQLDGAASTGSGAISGPILQRIAAYADVFQALMHFAIDDAQWAGWVDEVRPAWRRFATQNPHEAGYFEILETRLVKPVAVAYRSGVRARTRNSPRLLDRDF